MVDSSHNSPSAKEPRREAQVEEAESVELLDAPPPPSPEDERVQALLEHTLDVPVLAEAVEKQLAADAADTLEVLREADAADVLERMDTQTAADALAEMEIPLAVSVIEDLIEEDKVPYAAQLLAMMASDDAADVVGELDDAQQERVLAAMPAPVVARLRKLIAYHTESAGGLMTIDFLALREDMTVAQATEAVRRRHLPEAMQHLFVVDRVGHLVGVLSLRALLLAEEDAPIAELLDPEVASVPANMDREAVARIFDRYDHYMLAVVDEMDRLLGVVTVDDVIDIIRKEQTEDVHKTVGAGTGEAVYSSLLTKFRGRVRWLSISLVLSCLAAAVVLGAEDLIARYTILAFLLPVIAALVGNAGHQALAVTLRGIVLGEVRRGRVWPLVAREGTVGLLNGLVLGTMLFSLLTLLTAVVEDASWRIGLVAGLATMIAMGIGTLAGSSIPLLMRRFGWDPAQSSAIFLIMITDAIAFSSLLALTALLLTTTG